MVPATSATCVDVNQHVQQPPHVPTSAVAITQGAVGLPLRAGPRGLHVRGVQAKPTVTDSLEQSPVRAHRACKCFHGQHLVGGCREFAQLHCHSRTVAYTMRPGCNDDEKQPGLGEPGTDAVCTVRAHGGILFSDVLFFLTVQPSSTPGAGAADATVPARPPAGANLGARELRNATPPPSNTGPPTGGGC